MPRGGARKGAGRKPGSVTKKTREAAERAIQGLGMTPLDHMLGVMNGTVPFVPEKFEAAKSAAPYVHARLAAVEHKGEMTTTYVMQAPPVSDTAEDWAKQHGHAVTH